MADDDPKSADPSKLDLSKFFSELVPPTKANLEKWRQEDEQYNQDLRSRAKTPEQLTQGLECTVLEVNDYQGSTSFTPRSEIVIEGHSSSYRGGHTYRTELKVQSDTLVEKLEFKGWPPLEAGDTIRAYILKGKQEAEKSFGPSCRDPFHQGSQTHLVERDYQPVEHPSKIEKLRDGKVVATYHNS